MPNLENLTEQLLAPGTLWSTIQARTQSAIANGSLLSIPTHYELIDQDGLPFLVRTLANIQRKESAKLEELHRTAETGKRFNPFLPYEQNLFVADLSSTHVAILNKFNVVDHHLLIITRAFESQEAGLTQADFAALWTGLTEIDGLAFYNGGKVAGASQPHKHLQLIPLPLAPEVDSPFLEILLTSNVSSSTPSSSTPSEQVIQFSVLPFQHAVISLAQIHQEPPAQVAPVLLQNYYRLLQSVGLGIDPTGQQTGAYNLLVTRRWMAVVARSQESFQAISVNSLGFAGSLFVKDQAQMELLKQVSPMEVLRQVCPPLG